MRGQANSGGLSVGAFVSLVSVTRRIGRIVVQVSDRVVAMQQGMAGLRDVSIMLNLTTGISAEVDKQQKEQRQLFDANEEDHHRRDRRRTEVGLGRREERVWGGMGVRGREGRGDAP